METLFSQINIHTYHIQLNSEPSSHTQKKKHRRNELATILHFAQMAKQTTRRNYLLHVLNHQSEKKLKERKKPKSNWKTK